jgi:peptidoglycan hydrolase CwlO-like protein
MLVLADKMITALTGSPWAIVCVFAIAVIGFLSFRITNISKIQDGIGLWISSIASQGAKMDKIVSIAENRTKEINDLSGRVSDVAIMTAETKGNISEVMREITTMRGELDDARGEIENLKQASCKNNNCPSRVKGI